MQIQVAGLLQFAVALFPTAEVRHTSCGSRAGRQTESPGDPDSPSPASPPPEPQALEGVHSPGSLASDFKGRLAALLFVV